MTSSPVAADSNQMTADWWPVMLKRQLLAKVALLEQLIHPGICLCGHQQYWCAMPLPHHVNQLNHAPLGLMYTEKAVTTPAKEMKLFANLCVFVKTTHIGITAKSAKNTASHTLYCTIYYRKNLFFYNLGLIIWTLVYLVLWSQQLTWWVQCYHKYNTTIIWSQL